jgi:hypothetical protein
MCELWMTVLPCEASRKQILHKHRTGDIQPGQWFIQQEHVWIVKQSRAKAPLPHAFRVGSQPLGSFARQFKRNQNSEFGSVAELAHGETFRQFEKF